MRQASPKNEVIHVDTSLIRANVSCDSVAVRHVDAITATNDNPQQDKKELRQARNSKKTWEVQEGLPHWA